MINNQINQRKNSIRLRRDSEKLLINDFKNNTEANETAETDWLIK